MPNLRKQDATVVVHGDSRYNEGLFDTVSVHSIIVTDGPLPQAYYVPGGPSISEDGMRIIRKHGLEFRPYTEEELFVDVGDEVEEARQNDPVAVEDGFARTLLRSTLVSAPLQLIKQLPNNLHVYKLAYEYKIFPEQGSFQFDIRLPLSGIDMPSGEVTLSVLVPQNVSINRAFTKGIDDQGNELEEQLTELSQTHRQVVTFQHRVDPIFTVNYTHNEGLFQG